MAPRGALAVLAMAAGLHAVQAFTVPGHFAAARHGALDLHMQRIGSNPGRGLQAGFCSWRAAGFSGKGRARARE